MAVKRPVVSRAPDDTVRVRRSYFDCRFGQLHVRTAFPSSGGFDEQTTLVCVHAASGSSRAFSRFLPQAARDRSVYAPDLPGCGESEPPAVRPGIADYAAAIGDFLDQMRLRQVDLLGHEEGALIAAELALQKPEQVRRIVLVSPPLLSGPEREALHRASQPVPPAEDGSHLAREWQRSLDHLGPGMTLENIAEVFADRLRNGPNAGWGATAAHQYAAAERLPQLRQPVLVLRLHDHTWDSSAHVRTLIRGVKVIDLAEHGYGALDVAPGVLAQHTRTFLNAR